MKHKSYSKRDSIRDYFPLPNEIFALKLCAGEIAIYSYLLYLEDRKTYQCYPSYRTIGNAVDLSKNTVRKHITSLEVKQLILTEPTSILTQDGRRRNGSLLYTIRPIQDAVNYFHDQQLSNVDTITKEQKQIAKFEKQSKAHNSSQLEPQEVAGFDTEGYLESELTNDVFFEGLEIA